MIWIKERPEYWYCPRCVYKITDAQYRHAKNDYQCPRCVKILHDYAPRRIDFKPSEKLVEG